MASSYVIVCCSGEIYGSYADLQSAQDTAVSLCNDYVASRQPVSSANSSTSYETKNTDVLFCAVMNISHTREDTEEFPGITLTHTSQRIDKWWRIKPLS